MKLKTKKNFEKLPCFAKCDIFRTRQCEVKSGVFLKTEVSKICRKSIFTCPFKAAKKLKNLNSAH